MLESIITECVNNFNGFIIIGLSLAFGLGMVIGAILLAIVWRNWK